MTNHLLKLYRLAADSAGYGETSSAVVYAFSPEDALAALAEAFEDRDILSKNLGYMAAPANPYEVLEEVPFERGVVLAEGQDG